MDTGQSVVKLLRRVGTTLDFVYGFVEDFRDVQKTDNISVFVTYRLRIGQYTFLHNLT